MSPGEYVSILATLILGLAMADLVQSFHRLMTASGPVRWHWLSPLLALTMLLLILTFWWASFRWYSQLSDVTIGRVLPDIALFLTLFLATAVALPDEVSAKGIDLKDYYLSRASYYWGLQAAIIGIVILSATLRAPALTGDFFLGQLNNIVVGGISLLLVFFRRAWLDSLFAIAMFAMAIGVHAGTSMR